MMKHIGKAVGTVFFFFVFCLPAVLSALPLENLVSPSHAQRLFENGEMIVETQLSNNPFPVLLPDNDELHQIITNARASFKPNIFVETLYLYKKPENYHSDFNTWDETQKTGILNQALALGTLTGVQYFSSSRNVPRTFYEHSTVIDGPQTKKPLPDPVYLSLPAALTLYARQKDLTFGDNIYRYDYEIKRDFIVFTQENVTSLSIGIINAIGKGNLRSAIAVIDCGDSLLIYAVSMVKALTLSSLRDRISNSFSSRAEAILKWFTNRLDNQLFNF